MVAILFVFSWWIIIKMFLELITALLIKFTNQLLFTALPKMIHNFLVPQSLNRKEIPIGRP